MVPEVETLAPRWADRRGGALVTLTAPFAEGVPLHMWLVSGGRRFACHSGLPGHGTNLLPLGQTLTAVLPALPDDVQRQLAVVLMSLDDNTIRTLPYSVDAVAPFFDSQTYSLRSVWAPVWATGARELAAEADPV